MSVFLIKNNKSHAFDFNGDMNILKFKKNISDEFNIIIKNFYLIYGGKILQDEYCFNDYNISRDANIFLYYK